LIRAIRAVMDYDEMARRVSKIESSGFDWYNAAERNVWRRRFWMKRDRLAKTSIRPHPAMTAATCNRIFGLKTRVP
jgi:hypothetical protein